MREQNRIIPILFTSEFLTELREILNVFSSGSVIGILQAVIIYRVELWVIRGRCLAGGYQLSRSEFCFILLNHITEDHNRYKVETLFYSEWLVLLYQS